MNNVLTQFQYINNYWSQEEASKLNQNEVDLFLYRSNCLGRDLRITNYGGGNTSCKTTEINPLTQEPSEIMWIKGSGGDIGTLNRAGLAALYMDKLRALEGLYKGIEFEDEMVTYFGHCLYDLQSRSPSIDTPLHAFLPFNHIDHLHPDAIIAIAASKDGKQINQDLFEGQLGWVDWQRPGFDLGLKLRECLEADPGIRGIMLGGHGLFTWGDTSYDCYINSLEVIDKASAYLTENYGKTRPVFGGVKVQSLVDEKRQQQATKLMPILRGLCSQFRPMVGHFTDDEKVLEFINSQDLEKLAPKGTSCPDHFLRTKIQPLVLKIPADSNLENTEALKSNLQKDFDAYRVMYQEYYEACKHPDSPAMRDPNPVIILWPSIGLFSFAKNKQTARVASEFYINAINVMKGAEAVSEYVALSPQEAFNIEYWALEEAKLQRLPLEKPLSAKVALITGATGGIGKAIAEKLQAEGAVVVYSDLDEKSLSEIAENVHTDKAIVSQLDVTKEETLESTLQKTILNYGGVDIVVNCAGLAISKPLEETTLNEWDLLQNVMVKGQFEVSRKAVEVMRKQEMGGDIINIASKNALVSGPNNVGYGTAKAAQIHMSRLLAAELGKDKIRVNVVNPDAVIKGSKIWEGKWAEGRAKAHNISPEELPAHYAKRTLLNTIIEPADIANAVFAFVSGLLGKSTGNILNVDGGIAAAFVR